MVFYFGAGGENRTRIVCLEGRHISHYTTPADSDKYIKLCYTTKHKVLHMADLNQFLNKDLTADDVAHSNGYASVAGGGGAGGLSMERRRQLLNQPRVVGAYQYSRLGRQGSAVKARTADQDRGRVYDASSDSFDDKANVSNRQANDIKDRSKIDTKSIDRRQHFIEPASRPKPAGYDKYA